MGLGLSFYCKFLRFVFSELNPRAKEERDERRRKLLEDFRTAPFEEIVARSEAKV